jgi:hypothetical protein
VSLDGRGALELGGDSGEFRAGSVADQPGTGEEGDARGDDQHCEHVAARPPP